MKDKKKVLIIIFIVTILFVVVQILSPLLIRKYAVQAYKIPAGSMLPTLEIGDHILVNKSTKAKASIQRGDIIVFKYPEDPKRDFIKRVIGVPGDILQVKDKQVYINGNLLNEPYIQHSDAEIKAASFEPRDNFGPLKIPENNFFVLRDNRDRSYDSRYSDLFLENPLRERRSRSTGPGMQRTEKSDGPGSDRK